MSIGCEPCTRPTSPGQHERQGRWWWEDVAQPNGKGNGVTRENGTVIVSDIFNTQNVVSLSRTGVENLTKLETEKNPRFSRLMHHGANSAR